MIKNDIQLKIEVEQELSWDPKINAAQIGVTVENGVVCLRGDVDSYAELWAAEDATKRVNGVRTLAQELRVKILDGDKRDDSDIAAAVQSALKWDVFVPNSVIAKVTNGTVTLEGEVPWNFERDAAEKAVRHLTGVMSVCNSISLKPQVSNEMVKEKVQAALQRQAKTDAHSIKIETSGGTVTLSGHASSWQSIEDASNAAWAAPGVTDVVQHISLR